MGRQKRLSFFLWVRDCAIKRIQKYKGLAFCAATSIVPLTTHAAEFTVDTLSDIDDDGSTLREAIVAANNTPEEDTISFAAGLSGTLVLGQGELDITTDITISGPDERITISGDNDTRIFDVSASTVSISNLVLTNASTQETFGGAIRVSGAELTLTNCEVSNNFCAGDGGGIGTEAAGGNLILINSEFSNNVALGSGGAISSCDSEVSLTNCEIFNNMASESGGGVSAKIFEDVVVSLALTNCVITDNSASGPRGGGVYAADLSMASISDSVFSGNAANSNGINQGNGGGFSGYDISTLNIQNCTFSENESTFFGGGVSIEYCTNATVSNSTLTENSSNIGGGLASYSGDSIAVTNCTIIGNSSETPGGGIYNQATGTQIISNCTITGNTSNDDERNRGGGGIRAALTSLEISNSICAFNSGVGSNSDLFLDAYTSFMATAPNLFSDSSFPLNVDPDNVDSQNDNNPLLDGIQIFEDDPANVFAATSVINGITTGTLADNGGTVPTLLLLTGGAANNVGLSSALSADVLDLDDDGNTTESLPVDARGFARVSGSAIDLGAVELDQATASGLTLVELDEEGNAILTFGLSQELGPGESWILSRSTGNLTSFEPIFRFDGAFVQLEEEGNTSNFDQGTNSFTITDTDPPQTKAFYLLQIDTGIIVIDPE